MKSVKVKKIAIFLLLGSLGIFSNLVLADDNARFYAEWLVGTSLKNLSETSNLVGALGASGYSNLTSGPIGTMGDTHTSSRTSLGLKAGYQYSDSIKLDVSFYSLGYGNTTWGTDFNYPNAYNSAIATPFTGSLTSKTVFFSAYYTLNLDGKLKPYVGAGLGPSWNKFGQAQEGNYNFIYANTNVDLAYKIDLGAQYQINDNLGLDFGVSLIDVGEFKSANKRGTNHEPIGPYKFSADLSPIVNLGLVYKF
jgi:outer membrane protein W